MKPPIVLIAKSRMIVIATLYLFLAFPAMAKLSDPPTFTRNAVEPFVAQSLPIDPMHAGLWEATVAPGYFAQKSMHAFGGGASVTRAFSDHWGISVVFADASMSGREGLHTAPPAGTSFNSAKAAVACPDGCLSGSVSGNGFFGALSGIWDFRSGDDFRFPLLLGLSYVNVTGTVDDSSDGLKRTGSLRSAGLAGGLAPQFNAGKLFRISPFGLFTYAFQASKESLIDYNPATKATNTEADFKDRGAGVRWIHAIGAQFTFRPWNLTYTWVLNTEGQSSHIPAYTKRWGR